MPPECHCKAPGGGGGPGGDCDILPGALSSHSISPGEMECTEEVFPAGSLPTCNQTLLLGGRLLTGLTMLFYSLQIEYSPSRSATTTQALSLQLIAPLLCERLGRTLIFFMFFFLFSLHLTAVHVSYLECANSAEDTLC